MTLFNKTKIFKFIALKKSCLWAIHELIINIVLCKIFSSEWQFILGSLKIINCAIVVHLGVRYWELRYWIQDGIGNKQGLNLDVGTAKFIPLSIQHRPDDDKSNYPFISRVVTQTPTQTGLPTIFSGEHGEVTFWRQ